MHIPLMAPSRGALLYACCLLVPGVLAAQTSPELGQILDRLDRLEQQNRELTDEVHQLRQELATARAQTPPAVPAVEALQDKVDVTAARTEEMAQSKVEASQHFPIRLTGMALFNGYLNSKGSGGFEYPIFAWPGALATGGGSLRQTIIGLDYQGPLTFLGGKVRGSVYMDFFGGSGSRLDQNFRIRTGEIEIDWASRSILAGIQSPIFAPRSPDSLAQVAVAPLSGAGNLWFWIPQVRFEQRFNFSDDFGLRAQIGVVQTVEGQSAYQPSVTYVEAARPGVEGRFELFHGNKDGRRFEIAPGFHTSRTHVIDMTVPSNLFSLDWFARPVDKLEFKGAFFTGQNVGHLGGLQGFTVLGPQQVIPVHAKGGWAQITIPATSRLAFHLFSGVEDDRNSDLVAGAGAISRNWLLGANLFYHLSPNVLVGLEASQARSAYIGMGTILNNHYDLALAYLF